MIVLDTNVVSELMRKTPDQNVLDWVDQHPVDNVFITAVTAAELWYGVERLPDGHRRTVLTAKVAELLTEDFGDQILPFGGDEVEHYARITAARDRSGKPIGMADAQIAAICRRYHADLATRNLKDFVVTGVHACNPWDGSATPR